MNGRIDAKGFPPAGAQQMANRIPPNRIGSHGPGGVDVGATRATRAERTEANAGARRPEPAGDTVQLTDTAAQLQKLEARLRTQPDVDAARVEALRQRIAAGEYQMDPGRIAAKLLRFERSL
jgi:negative regulator of flagellin synthesis FlgM